RSGDLPRAEVPLLGQGRGRRGHRTGPERGRADNRAARGPHGAPWRRRHRGRLRPDREDDARRRRGRSGRGHRARGHRPALDLPARRRHGRRIGRAHRTAGRRPRSTGLLRARRRARRPHHRTLLLPSRGAGAPGRRLPHPVPCLEARGTLSARTGPGAGRRRPHPDLPGVRARRPRRETAPPRGAPVPSYQQFRLPDVGEGLTEADIVTWSVAAGDTVATNQQLCEIETAKSVVELPSPYSGRVHEILAAEGATVEVGAPIVVIDVDPGGPEADGDGGAGAAESSIVGGAEKRGADPARGEPDPAASDVSEAAEEDSSGAVLVGYGTRPATAARRHRLTTVTEA